MRPKTFPATTYSGNSRQRLQEIREGLKQPSKSSAQGLPVGPNSDTSLDAKVLGSKDAARQQQQQQRATPKFGPYQKALREIRYSLLPFANESGTSAAAEVNRQMLQELVNAGCDQEMAGRALKQTGSRSIEAALEYISKMGYLDPRNEQIVRVIKQTSPGKGLVPTPVSRRPSFEGTRDSFVPYHQLGGAAYEGPGFSASAASALEEVPRQYVDFLFPGAGPHGVPGPQHQPKGYPTSAEAAGAHFPAQGPHYGRPHLLVQGEPLGYGVQRTLSFQTKTPPEVGGYASLAAKGQGGPLGASLAFPLPAAAALYLPHPHHKQAGPAAHQLHVLGARGQVFASDSPPQSLLAPSRNSLQVDMYELSTGDGLDTKDEHPLALGGAHPLDAEYGSPERRCPPPPYPRHLLRHSKSEQYSLDGQGSGVEQGLRGGPAAEPADRGDKSLKSDKGDKGGKDKKQIQTSPVPVRKNSRDEEKRESRIKSYSPYAFKFFMEQHVENVIKTYQQKVNRRMQLEQEMAKAGLCEAEQEQMRKILYQKESNYNRLKRAKMDKSMFVKIKTLGIGAFGEVCLACKVDTHALYAMKTLRKKDVLNRNQVAHVKAERDILAEADNEWVVKLYYSFQDKDSLYFVMDYIPGGDMMSLLIRMEVFPESLARFYIAELTLAIESVHKMGFIHRDIKPDNILIDLDGHIKLTDFGLCTGFRWTHNSKYYQKGNHIRQDSMEPSDLWDDVSNCRCGERLKTLEQRARKQHQRCLAHSLVGTPNYIAPEVLLRKGYTQLCDWWSVGVILFEMLVGQPPFLAPTPTETQLKVINWESTLHFPSQVTLSPEARDLITRLCCSADHRLGRDGADDLKAHPFFSAIDFSSDIRKQPAPYVPTISHPMDTSNFDPVDEESPWNDASEGSAKAWDTLTSPGNKHPEHAFYEFTFRRFFDDNGYPFRCPKPSAAEASQSENSDLENSDLVEQTEGCQPVYV
ncbi:PREDICTED: serine/threonine-protein kinase LATS2 [Galeopterus variegatus]|uniref:non-specific serine/threonine protein kinase n=1 Tax=Galeopterus variegatus TaxID=482537 RepID=A0ABM0QU46_GALVR|nr:PREDICTED: serine/threonine-protein kinase LATS2 [Galeopterus variegatus]